MPAAAIEAYVAGGEPFGKAGAYAIQGAIAAWIEHIDGSHSGIMGLPLFETARFAAPRPAWRWPRLVAMANQDILINWAPQETRVAIVENGAVQELHIERTLERGLVGNVYLGKVARVLPGMQSAFIDIGLDRAAFLHVADLQPAGQRHRRGAARRRPRPIERQMFEGQSLTVQVIKDPIGSKGARLSTQVVDRRAHARLPAARQAHRHLAEDRLGRSCASSCARACRRWWAKTSTAGGGFILRTNAEEASDAELADDIAYLRKTWAGIRERAHSLAARHAAAPGPEPGRARAARPEPTTRRRPSASTRDCSTTSSRPSARPTCRAVRPSSSITAASGRSSTCSASRTRSRARWRARSS